jgi:hypothetical protein
MSKTVSATPMRAPGTPCGSGVPGDPGETLTLEEHPTQLAHKRNSVGAARQRGSSPRVTSNLTQPAGVLSWERDFLLGLAVNVLEDFVGNTNEEGGEHNGESDEEHQ